MHIGLDFGRQMCMWIAGTCNSIDINTLRRRAVPYKNGGQDTISPRGSPLLLVKVDSLCRITVPALRRATAAVAVYGQAASET
jgi:hypothetical protein